MEIDLEITLSYKKKNYTFIDSFGYPTLTEKEIKDCVANGETEDGSSLWNFYWEEGNCGCDCNRSALSGIAKEYPELCDGSGAFPCGDTIELVEIKPVVLLKKAPSLRTHGVEVGE